MAELTAEHIDKLRDKFSTLTSQLDDTNKSVQTLGSSIKAPITQIGKLSTTLDIASKSFLGLSNSLKLPITQIGRLNTNLDRTAKLTQNYNNYLLQANRNTTNAIAKTKEAGDSNKGLAASLSRLGETAKHVFTGLSAAIVGTVAVADPYTFKQFTLTLRDLAGVIGQILSPVLESVTIYIRQFADWIINLDDSTKEIIGQIALVVLGFTALAPVLLTVASVVSLVSTVAGLVAPLLTAVASGIGAIGAALLAALGPIGLAIAAVAAIGAAVYGLYRLFRKSKTEEPVDKTKAEQSKSSVGAGGRGVSFISSEELQRQVLTATLQRGRGDPAETAIRQRERTNELLRQMLDKKDSPLTVDQSRPRREPFSTT